MEQRAGLSTITKEYKVARITQKDNKDNRMVAWTIPKEEFARLVREHNGALTDVEMTPIMAAWILETYNTGNRKMRMRHAEGFSAVLTEGRWGNTGEPIIFAKEGILNSGQHRLEGIVLSGKSALVDIRFGIPRKEFANTDTGAKRAPGDVLHISGAKNANASAAAIRLLLAYEAGLPGSFIGIKVDNAQILEAFERWPEVETAVELNMALLSNRKGFINSSANAFVFLAIRQMGESGATEFLTLLESGLTKNKNDAPRLLRERLMSDSRLTLGHRAAVVERFALYIKAWNYWRAGTQPSSLRWRPTEAFPVMKNARL